MLNQDQLVALQRELADEQLLTVYVDVDVKDPARRDRWRKLLDTEVERCRESLESEEEQAAFDAAWEQWRALYGVYPDGTR